MEGGDRSAAPVDLRRRPPPEAPITDDENAAAYAAIRVLTPPLLTLALVLDVAMAVACCAGAGG